MLQEGKIWNYILVDSSVFDNVKKVDARLRQQVLERLRKPDKDFLEKDAKVLLCTATLTASKGNCQLRLRLEQPQYADRQRLITM